MKSKILNPRGRVGEGSQNLSITVDLSVERDSRLIGPLKNKRNNKDAVGGFSGTREKIRIDDAIPSLDKVKRKNKIRSAKSRLTSKEILYFTLSAAIIICMSAIMIRPDRYSKAFENGLSLFVLNVLPAIFPYLFFTKILSSLGVPEKMAKLLRKPLKIFGLPSSCAFLVVMSFISGYPMGAKLTKELYDDGGLSSSGARAATALTSISGPIFIIGTVGAAIFKSVKAGFILYAANFAASILNGLVWRNKNYVDTPMTANINKAKLSDAVYDTVMTVLVVGGYIAIFNMVADMLKDFGVIEGLSNAIDLVPIIRDSGASEGLVYGLLEMTKGCMTLSKAGTNALILAFSAGVTAFGGLSVIIQSVTFLSACKVSFGSFLIRKITQSLFAFLICLAISLLIGV